MMNDDDVNDFVVDFEKIINSKKMMPTTRLLAMSLQRNPYMTVKSFLEGLTNEELDTLLHVCDQGISDSDTPITEGGDRFSELILIAEMLSKAEGLHTSTTKEMTDRTNSLITFLACEGLARKGMVEVWRENMSLGEDMGDKIIVRNIDT